jgi:hypothetical protein
MSEPGWTLNLDSLAGFKGVTLLYEHRISKCERWISKCRVLRRCISHEFAVVPVQRSFNLGMGGISLCVELNIE